MTGAGLATWLWGSPWVHPAPWFSFSPLLLGHVYSVLLGATLGMVVALLTRPLTRRLRWARTLEAELTPLVRTLPSPAIFPLAILSALSEELLFRSLLQPALGLFGQALVFGLMHQIRGPARWIWVAWAGLMGLCLGTLYAATGSIGGPIVAHAVVNAMNLRYLKNHEPPVATRTPLGGVLGPSTLTHR